MSKGRQGSQALRPGHGVTDPEPSPSWQMDAKQIRVQKLKNKMSTKAQKLKSRMSTEYSFLLHFLLSLTKLEEGNLGKPAHISILNDFFKNVTSFKLALDQL